MSWDPVPKLHAPPSVTTGIPPLPSSTIGSHGYQPAPGDENTLARLIFAESGAPEDSAAIGWSIVNRVGVREFGKTLNAVRDQKNAFSSVANGGSPQYRLSADPSKMDAESVEKWLQAQQIAHGILNGTIPDPTGGGEFFFSSDHYNGDPQTAPGNYPSILPNLHASPYEGHAAASGAENYFFIENPKKNSR
jgi:hypothetical protein